MYMKKKRHPRMIDQAELFKMPKRNLSIGKTETRTEEETSVFTDTVTGKPFTVGGKSIL